MKKRTGLFILKFRRLMNLEVEFLRLFFDGRRFEGLSPTARLVRLGDDGGNRISLLDKTLKRGDREPGGSQENYRFHSPCFTSFRIFRLIMSRLIKLRWSRKNTPFR